MRYLRATAIAAGACAAVLTATGPAAAAAETGDPRHAVYVCELTVPPNADPFFTGEKVVVLERLSGHSFVRSAERPTIQDVVSDFCLDGFGSW